MSSAGPEQVAAFLKLKLEQRCSNLREAFRKLDKSNTGFLSNEDFEATLRDFNIRLTRSALAAVVEPHLPDCLGVFPDGSSGDGGGGPAGLRLLPPDLRN